MGLCRVVDDFIREKLCWFVILSNDEIIYQDDHRPGEEEPVAWIRLGKYLREKSLSIRDIYIKFCSHVEQAAPNDASGYYFVQAVDAVAFSSTTSTKNYYIIGHLEDNKVHATKWLVPEIIKIGTEIREVDPNDIKLIKNG